MGAELEHGLAIFLRPRGACIVAYDPQQMVTGYDIVPRTLGKVRA